MPGTRKLGRPTAHRNAMLRGMVTYLLENGKIETTLTRAKEVGALTEKMITLGKKNTLAARRQALAFITKEDVVKKLFDTVAPEYAGKNGGYVQIYKLGPRRGDGAEMALIQLIETEEKKDAKAKKNAKKSTKKSDDKSEKKAAPKAKAAKEEKKDEPKEEAVKEPKEAPAEEPAEAPAEEPAKEEAAE